MLQVDYLVVADAAVAANNRHYIHGTIDVLWATAFPVTHPALSIAIRLRVPWNDANTPFPLEIDLVDPDEESILPERLQGTITMGRPATAIPGEDGLVALVYNLAMIQFRKPGTHGVVLRAGGYELQRARFQVRHVANRQTVTPTPAPPTYIPPSQIPQAPHAPTPPPPSQAPVPFELLPFTPPPQTPQAPEQGTENAGISDQQPPPAPQIQSEPTADEAPGPPHLPFQLGNVPSAEPEAPSSSADPSAGA